MNILENCDFGHEILNELFFKKKIMEPDKAINYAISKLKSDLGADKVMKVSTKVNKAVEGTQKYKDFVEGNLNKLAIAQISFKTMIAQKMDLAVGVYEIDDENDCKRIIHYFANNFLFSDYVHIHPNGYHTSLEYDKNFAYIYLCKGGKE